SLFIYFANKNKFRFTFYSNFFKNFHIDTGLFKNITVAGIPLIINEVLYSLGIAAITQSYSTRGIEALAAYNISQTIIGLFIVFNLAMGDCISIMVGRLLGSGNVDEAVDTDRKLIVFSFMLALVVGIVLIILAPLFPEFYNTTDDVKLMATNMLRVGGAFLWISALYNASYFTLRSGGKTVLTLLFDSVGIVLISYPISFLLAKFTDLNVVLMYLIISVIDLYKVVLGLYLVGKKIWVKNLAK
ncbi:MAG: MATE family efflux transporter, partial [Finegoldia magna]|nr:MATE family efflux transporter [Finegoldia magna]